MVGADNRSSARDSFDSIDSGDHQDQTLHRPLRADKDQPVVDLY